MEPVTEQPNILATLLPLLIIHIPIVIAVNRLAIEKGKNAALWTILACIPLVNFYSIIYIVGTTNSNLEKKVDKILNHIYENGI